MKTSGVAKPFTDMLKNLAFAMMAGPLLFACSARAAAPTGNHSDLSFVNKVWRVSASYEVAPNTLYVFLSEGTLVITSPNTKPALGKWKDMDGALTMVEEGIAYKIDILKLSKDEFRIRSNNPGEPVEMTLVPADRPSQPAGPLIKQVSPYRR